MEFITPEEVAEHVPIELEGRPSGRDTVAALDAATAGSGCDVEWTGSATADAARPAQFAAGQFRDQDSDERVER